MLEEDFIVKLWKVPSYIKLDRRAVISPHHSVFSFSPHGVNQLKDKILQQLKLLLLSTQFHVVPLIPAVSIVTICCWQSINI